MALRSPANFLAGPYLDRAANWRRDEARLRAALEQPETLLVPVWRARSWVMRSEHGIAARFLADARRIPDADWSQVIFLGQFRGQLCFAVELGGEQPPVLEERTEFLDLRSIAGELPPDDAGVLAYARAMILWRERHRFCGRCGSPARPLHSGHVMKCSNPACESQQFPRIDPAIIVLVTDGERALLGRQASWPPRRYSTIAGFVEPGESLEDAVAREVLEETGVGIASVAYHSSQPWPFPSSLMLGFTARAASTAIVHSDQELEDARWFERSQLASGEILLPPQHSISFRLIEDWHDEAGAVPLRKRIADGG